MSPAPRGTAVIGGGWAGLAAAVEARQGGHPVTLFEMAPQWGGRARGVEIDGLWLDNGQHILIGAYSQTLSLMQAVGVDVQAALLRTPLQFTDAQGSGLRLNAGSPVPQFARAVLRHPQWRWHEKTALLAAAGGWLATGFRCAPQRTVADLAAWMPAALREGLIDPLCVAALNTPAAQASGAVFLRVLKDALFSGPGSADLLLPRVDLSALLPSAASAWLQQSGAEMRLSHRVHKLARQGPGWTVDGEGFDRVVLATTPIEAARLVTEIAPEWAEVAGRMRHEPIVTCYLSSARTRLPEPMLALPASRVPAGADAPAQFVFDRGQLGGAEGLLAFVISGAQRWVDLGLQATEAAVLQQASSVLKPHLRAPLQAVKTLIEKRATFRCVPGLQRPALRIAPHLHAAGDFVVGPYPATLEGAVRSGVAAVRNFEP